MKKFLFIFLFLLIAGYVFVAGWTQSRIKPDSCGIVKSRLGGIKEKPVIPGEFSWHWDFIIPKNAKMEQFSMLPFSAEKKFSGQTPVNELYTVLYNENMNYSFDFSLSLAITPDAIIRLAKKNVISTDEDLKTYMNNIADYVCQLAANYYITKAQSDPNFKPESVKRSDLVRAIAINEEYPDIDIAVLALSDYKIPNYSLYTKFQNMIITDPSLLYSFSSKNQPSLSVDQNDKKDSYSANSKINDNSNIQEQDFSDSEESSTRIF